MELKLKVRLNLPKTVQSFNRTFMELKCLLRILWELEVDSFNRTFMELKLIHSYRRSLAAKF